jgi:predicted nucleic acid-binding Zn ribbon protein
MIRLEPEENDRRCEECGKELHGRIDQRFCNDLCRNDYNRKKRIFEQRTEPEFIRQVFNVIRRNYKILERFNANGDNRLVSRQILIEQGFSFKFFTSIHQTQKGEIYKYVFDYGWLATESGKILLVRKIEQADI